MAQGPGQEAHGGSTYCSIATLVLTGFLDHLPHQDKLTRWLLERQVTGFQGSSPSPVRVRCVRCVRCGVHRV
jgi:geranylgeranyl transferase type-1 subunit beta